MKEKITKINDFKFLLPKENDLHSDAFIFMNQKLFDNLEENAIKQLSNISALPGVFKNAMVMPDAHVGYGFPIGGVVAIDKENGCISPGGIGFDINCGVRLLSSNLLEKDIKDKMSEILEYIFSQVPSGVGGSSKIKLSDEDLDKVLNDGAKWAVSNGYGVEEDLDFCEDKGCMNSADASKISPRAKARGRKQLGTLGAGNHFLEIQVVDEIFDEDVANVFGLNKGQIVIMIHCGSRGLGHQVCSDYLRRMEDKYEEVVKTLPEKDLIYAPSGSELAKDYFAAMSSGANFAWTNRHIIGHLVRKSFKKLFPKSKIKTVYDVAHNIAKEEMYEINGMKKSFWIHRKGATRAFGPRNEEIPEKYKSVGQPVILPGSMGTSSYVLVGTDEAKNISFSSSAHGAGRVMSRVEAKKTFSADKVKEELKEKNILVKAASQSGISEEAPGVYKDVSEVVNVMEGSGICKKVVRMRPLGVIKG